MIIINYNNDYLLMIIYFSLFTNFQHFIESPALKLIYLFYQSVTAVHAYCFVRQFEVTFLYSLYNTNKFFCRCSCACARVRICVRDIFYNQFVHVWWTFDNKRATNIYSRLVIVSCCKKTSNLHTVKANIHKLQLCEAIISFETNAFQIRSNAMRLTAVQFSTRFRIAYSQDNFD